jgi:hypothetical protein
MEVSRKPIVMWDTRSVGLENERKAPLRFWGRSHPLFLEGSLVLERCSRKMLIFVQLKFTETGPLFAWPVAQVLMKTLGRLLPVPTVWRVHF